MNKYPENNIRFQRSQEATEKLMKLSGERVKATVVCNSVSMSIEGKLSYTGDQKWRVESDFDASLNFSIEDVSEIGKQERITYSSNYLLITPQ